MGQPEEKRQFGRSRLNGSIIIELILKEYYGRSWTGLDGFWLGANGSFM